MKTLKIGRVCTAGWFFSESAHGTQQGIDTCSCGGRTVPTPVWNGGDAIYSMTYILGKLSVRLGRFRRTEHIRHGLLVAGIPTHGIESVYAYSCIYM